MDNNSVLQDTNTVKPTTPDIYNPRIINKTDSNINTNSIKLPQFTTRKEPIISNKTTRTVTSSRVPSAVTVKDPILEILLGIDPKKLTDMKASGKNQAYSLNQLKKFASDLNIPSSNKSKPNLIKDILQLRKEKGLN